MSSAEAVAEQPVTAQETASGLSSLYELVHGDCFEWLDARAENSIHAVVTDPPYGLKEYTELEKGKLRSGRGGVWRMPPTLDGCRRRPLPRFTVLTAEERHALQLFFNRWARLVLRVLAPGGHVFIASNPLVSHLVYVPMVQAGFEKRGEIIRLVQTLRGGDRPKNAHREFADVTVMPRSCWEPWGLFRKPCEGRVQDNLRTWGTGGLRRMSEKQPFQDVIKSAPTSGVERDIAPHPSLKPQGFMRQIVRAALPMAKGVVLVLRYPSIFGYRCFSRMRASSVVKRQSTVAVLPLRSACQAVTSACSRSASAIRRLVHWRLSTLNSHSAMLSQLPCLGV